MAAESFPLNESTVTLTPLHHTTGPLTVIEGFITDFMPEDDAVVEFKRMLSDHGHVLRFVVGRGVQFGAPYRRQQRGGQEDNEDNDDDSEFVDMQDDRSGGCDTSVSTHDHARPSPTMTSETETMHAPTQSHDVSHQDLTNTARDRARHRELEHGNYRNYYNHRQQATPDARLSLLPLDLFRDKSVLDLGCNAGKLTVEVVEHCGAKRSKGIDIDPVLVDQAQRRTIDGRISWECADFVQEDAIESGEWDTIMLLSVTKWLHLHAGDEGMRMLFKRLHDVLPAGGTLIVEPQEKENYAKAARKNKNLRPVFQSIRMWPPFEQELRDVGFQLLSTIEREEGGFSRPLMIWRKSALNLSAETTS
ncbi:hypothetical protein ACM66B_002583 [Microbotryomycetes sp. NB124-2]